jgi:spermidine synthase
VVLSGAVLMSLEILGSRVLAPHYGSSVYVWGSLITTFLMALAVGYWLGGRLADYRPHPAAVSLIVACAAVLILPAVVWGGHLLRLVNSLGWEVRWSALAASFVLFLPPSLALGMVTPFAVRISASLLEKVGSVSGRYSALSAAGSILGTLLTAFVLIPAFSVAKLLVGLAFVLVLCAVLLMRSPATIAVATLATMACGVAALATRPPASATGEKILFYGDTAYHHISVTELHRTRYMRFDNLTQTMLSLEHPDRFLTSYERSLLLSWAVRPSIRSVCQIGLGGASFARAVARVLPDASIVSVEIDPVVADIARKYFLYQESPKVRTVVEDGRVFLTRPGESFDLIVLDAFNSTGVPFHLMTREFFEIVRKRLKPDGVFAANFIGKLMGTEGRLFWASYRTIRRQFGQVYVVSGELAAGNRNPQGTMIVLATVSGDPVSPETLLRNAQELSARWRIPGMGDLPAVTLHAPEVPAGIPELTDSYAPVEALQHF